MSNISLKVALGVLMLWFANVTGGAVSGRFFPVTSDFIISRIEPAPNGSSRIWGSFNLLRPSCSFIAVDWGLFGNARTVGVAVVFEEGSKSRGGGAQSFGPWLVQLTPSQLKNSSSAIVHHKCPWRPWVTETHLYP